MDSWWKTPWQFFCFFFHPPLCVCVFACVEMEGRGCETQVQQGGEGRGLGRGGGRQTWQKEDSLFRFPPSALPLRTRYGSPAACSSRHRRGTGGSVGDQRVVEVVLLPSSLERARQFVKAFGERGGNLHVT